MFGSLPASCWFCQINLNPPLPFFSFAFISFLFLLLLLLLLWVGGCFGGYVQNAKLCASYFLLTLTVKQSAVENVYNRSWVISSFRTSLKTLTPLPRQDSRCGDGGDTINCVHSRWCLCCLVHIAINTDFVVADFLNSVYMFTFNHYVLVGGGGCGVCCVFHWYECPW